MSPARRRARRARGGAPRTVLVLTHSGDVYVPDVVADALRARGLEPVRVDTDRFPADITLTTGGDGRALLSVDDAEIDLVRTHAVWCRRIWTARAPLDVDARFAGACEAQADASFEGMLALLEDLGVRFVNPLAAQRRAELKAAQLVAARGVPGFAVPETVVTNDPGEARAFIAAVEADGGRVVCKLLAPLSESMDGAGPFVGTSPVDAGDAAALDALRAAPMIFQRRVEKRADVRAVVVGRRVLAASLASPPGALDWRRAPAGAERAPTWRAARLPAAVERACAALVARLGLSFGAVDLGVDVGGTHWFFEVNPAGEWGWLQRDAGLDVAGALADLLAAGPASTAMSPRGAR